MGGLTAQALAARLLSYTTVSAAAAASLLVRRGHRLAAISTGRDSAGRIRRDLALSNALDIDDLDQR